MVKIFVHFDLHVYNCFIIISSTSSLSSGINSMAANTVEDVLVNYLKNTSQWAQTLVAKLIGNYQFYFKYIYTQWIKLI